MTTTTTAGVAITPITRVTPRHAATVANAGAAGFLVLLGLLHAIKPELSPTWRMISEYEIGRNGWVMSTAFALLAIACVATARAIRPITANRAGRVGRIALRVSAAGMLLAAVATADPVTATPDQLTTHGSLHGLGAMVGIPAFVVAAIAVNRSVRASGRHGGVRAATAAVVIALVVFVMSMAAMFDGPPATPDVRIGIQNRILVVSYAAWVLVAARLAASTTRAR